MGPNAVAHPACTTGWEMFSFKMAMFTAVAQTVFIAKAQMTTTCGRPDSLS